MLTREKIRNLASRLESDLSSADGPSLPALLERIILWGRNTLQIQEPQHLLVGDDEDHRDNENAIEHAKFVTYQNMILRSDALDVLVARLRSRCWQTDGRDDLAACSIHQQISEALRLEKPRRRVQPTEHRLVLRLNWGHVADLPWRERRARLGDMVITACSERAQLSSREQYLRQVWPWSGRSVLDLVQHAMYAARGKPHASNDCLCVIPSGKSAQDARHVDL